MEISVCGFETLSLEKNPISLTLSKNKDLETLNDFTKYFVNNDTSGNCQVSSYKLILQSDSSEYAGEIIELNILRGKLNIFPSKSLDLEIDETLSLYLQAETRGFKQEKLSITIELLLTKINTNIINQAPNFKSTPP